MNLKEQVINANKTYRSGYPIMEDQEYDLLLSKLEQEMNFIEFEIFKKSLMEDSGNFQHSYVIGSLNKVKYGEGELEKWLTKNKVNSYIVSEKLDGCSFVASYRNGLLVYMSSRGDGLEGTDWTAKGKYILPEQISFRKDLDIRGELILNNYKELGMKNRRNGISGIMGRDEIDPETLKNITPYVYQILNLPLTMKEQFEFLKEISFNIPDYKIFTNLDTLEEDLFKFYIDCKEKNIEDYDIDGLVVSSVSWKNENNEYYPKGKIAFKVNSEGYETEVIDIEWNVSQGGLLKPVVIIKPVEIDGANISRVSGNNFQWLKDRSITIGSIVKIIRSGGVIPKIIDVVSSPKHDYNIAMFVCPECESKLVLKGVDLACSNEYCSAVIVQKVTAFLRNCGVEDVTEKSLIKWSINSFETLVNWEPDPKYKSEIKFYESLQKNVFSKPAIELFSKFVFDGGAEKTINKLIDFYGVDVINYHINNNNLPCVFPEGIGSKTIEKISSDWKKNLIYLDMICMDKRYNPNKEDKKTIIKSEINGKTFCITGTLSKKRSDIENDIITYGGKISSVSKKLDYLVVGSDAGSKLEKAKSLDINIITEKELYNMF